MKGCFCLTTFPPSWAAVCCFCMFLVAQLDGDTICEASRWSIPFSEGRGAELSPTGQECSSKQINGWNMHCIESIRKKQRRLTSARKWKTPRDGRKTALHFPYGRLEGRLGCEFENAGRKKKKRTGHFKVATTNKIEQHLKKKKKSR